MRAMKLRALVGIAGLVVTLAGAKAVEAQSPGPGKMWKLTIVSGGLETPGCELIIRYTR